MPRDVRSVCGSMREVIFTGGLRDDKKQLFRLQSRWRP